MNEQAEPGVRQQLAGIADRVDILPDPLQGKTPAASSIVEKKRVFIVDDHAMFRDGLRQLIDREADLVVCGEAADADEALEGISKSQPNLVIVDISLSGKSGIDLIKAIEDEHEDLPVLVVSMHEESLYAERALRAGAMGYVMKQEPSKTVKVAIRKVLAGEMHLSEKMAGSLISKLMRGTDEHPPSPLEKLSDRELEVFRLLGLGKKVRQIAEEMSVTIPTINSFRNRIKEKLQLNSSTEVALHAIHWSREEAAK
jgi:DNA-binding NarL/FixJ family response regulator